MDELLKGTTTPEEGSRSDSPSTSGTLESTDSPSSTPSSSEDLPTYSRPPVSEDQARLLDGKERIQWIGAGTKTGKTVGGSLWCLEGLLQGERVAWVGPWNLRTRTGWELIKGYLVNWESHGYAKFRENPHLDIEVSLTTNGKIGKLVCFSGDNYNAIYGEAFDRVFVDEATRQPEGVFPAVRSTVTATGGRLKIAFNTDRSGKHWAIREFKRAQSGSEPTYGFVTMPTSASPYVNPQDVEDARRILPERVFRALYNAEVMDDGAGVFRDPRACIWETELDWRKDEAVAEDPIFGLSYVMGVDLARKHDWTVITVFSRRTRRLVYFARFHGLPWYVQRERIADVARRYNNARCIVDASGVGDPNVEEMQRMGLSLEPFIFSPTSKRPLIEKLVVAIEQQHIQYPLIQVLLNELEAYEYKVTALGNLTYDAADGYHDDCVISLALANHGLGVKPRRDGSSDPIFGETMTSNGAFGCL